MDNLSKQVFDLAKDINRMYLKGLEEGKRIGRNEMIQEIKNQNKVKDDDVVPAGKGD